MIKAVIFDLDGILIDSGPFWDEAETIVLSGLGIPFSLDLAKETIGLRTDELVTYGYDMVAEVRTLLVTACEYPLF